MKQTIAILTALSLSPLAALHAADSAKPNIVYMLADDLGWSDISAHPDGSIPSPQIDKLFKQGVEMRNFMGWCVCSPTRAMLLTGRHPFRVGTGPETDGELEKAETTIAEGFKANGYATGIFGKWHNREYRPQDAGYTDDFITQHAIEFIRENKDRAFFCYVPFHIVHAPLQAKDTDLQGVDAKVTDATKRTYAAMVMAMDKNVAALLAELDKLGLRDNTIVIFTSENGATKDGSNLPFRGGKHTVFEGGTRLPSVIYWPKGNMIGGRTWDGLCGALDMFPTLMAMAALKMPETRPLDGKNIWPALRDNTASPVESYYWAWHNEDAIRTADWRLHRFFDHNELYNIRTDIAEATNVAGANPEVVKSLTAKMNTWAESLGAALTHQAVPEKLNAPAAPESEVLEVSVTVTAAAKPKDQLVLPFAGSSTG